MRVSRSMLLWAAVGICSAAFLVNLGSQVLDGVIQSGRAGRLTAQSNPVQFPLYLLFYGGTGVIALMVSVIRLIQEYNNPERQLETKPMQLSELISSYWESSKSFAILIAALIAICIWLIWTR